MKKSMVGSVLFLQFINMAGLLLFSGCKELDFIYVDRPEVFTRERLINRRLEEQSWLQKQLKNEAEFSFQGSRDVREFTGFALALKGEFNPLGGAQAESLLTDVKRNSRIGELQDELQVEVLRKQLEKVRSSSCEFALMPGQVTATNAPALPTNVTNPLPVASATINLNTFATNNLPMSPNPASLHKGDAQLTSIQSLDDKLAYRNAIQARLREQELDDTHDQNGMTLYTLKFDITVEPRHDNPLLGKVNLEILNPTNKLNETDFRNWVDALNRELRDESISLQRKYLMGHLTADEEMQVMYLASPQKTIAKGIIDALPITNKTEAKAISRIQTTTERSTNANSARRSTTILFQQGLSIFEDVVKRNPELDKAVDVIKSASSSSNETDTAFELISLQALLETLGGGQPTASGCLGLATVIRNRYQKALDGLVPVPLPLESEGVKVGYNVFYMVTAVTNSCSFNEFTKKMAEVESNAAAYVYTVEPKEYAQNISDVASREKLISYALALNAAIPQAGGSVGADMQYMHRSQIMLEAIKRRPLVVGFADGTSKFGWVLGPRFEIGEDEKVCFNHTPVQHSVQATVVVPAWWPSLTLNQSYEWLNADTIWWPIWTWFKNGMRSSDKSESKFVPVSLPRDYSAITRALLARADQLVNKPSILPRWNADAKNARQQITLRAGSDETVLIHGRDLWRNPDVYIGGQQATGVQVLPDMAGLRAEFKSIRLPAAEKREAQLVDLTVVTSGGYTVLRDGVRILPGSGGSPELAPFAQLKSSFVVQGGNMDFKVTPKDVPASYAEIVLQVKALDSGEPINLSAPGFNRPTGKNWHFPCTNAYFAALQDSQELEVGLSIRPTPDPTQNLLSVLQGGTCKVVFFKKPAESQIMLTKTINKTLTNGVNIAIDLTLGSSTDLFYKAYPWLKRALEGKSACLLCRAQGKKDPVFLGGVEEVAGSNRIIFNMDGGSKEADALSNQEIVEMKLVPSRDDLEGVPVTGELKLKKP
jgi:hypothetical protein